MALSWVEIQERAKVFAAKWQATQGREEAHAQTFRLKSDYQYSINIVYNNFPWPEATADQKAKIESAA
jgi:hypothetical protein